MKQLLCLLSSLVFLLSACTPARMAVDPSLAQASEMHSLQGFNARWINSDIHIGPWLLTSVREGWKFSWGLGIDDVDFVTASRPVQFQLIDADQHTVNVECRSRSIEVDALGVTIDVSDIARPRLRCGIESGAGEHRLTLSMALSGFAGEMSGTDFQIKSTDRLEGAALGLGVPVGYTISRAGQVVAAIEVINDGRFWVHHDLSVQDRLLVASMAAALLFFEPEMREA